MGRKTDETDNRNIEIALTLSGGGYRAAVFHLGVLSYLYHLKLDDGSRLLDHVTIMSTISGGTITGLQYLLALNKGGELPAHFANIFKQLLDNNLAEKLLESISKNKSNSKLSVIKELGNIYDNVFFGDIKFSKIKEIVQTSRIHHYAAYSTDISNALPFRFQAIHQKYGEAIVGNEIKSISSNKADKLRLADIQAASSCFPIAFEPINYPRDFFSYEENDEFAQSNMQTLLMDGGIIDNQGIDYLVEANKQLGGEEGDYKKGIDLAIISDASSPADGQPPIFEEHHHWLIELFKSLWKCLKILFYYITFWFLIKWILSLIKYFTFNGIIFTLFGITAVLLCTLWYCDGFKHVIPLSFAFAFSIIGSILMLGKLLAPDNIKKSDQFKIPSGLVWNIPFIQYNRLIGKRFESFDKVVSTVMMGHIRKKNIDMLASNNRWTNRFVIPCITTLTSNGPWKSDKEAKAIMEGSSKITSVTEAVSDFHSTLWFSDADKKLDIPNQILACGQLSMCYELYLWSKKNTGTGKNHIKVLNQLKTPTMKQKLLDDWEAFKSAPLFLTDLVNLK